MRQAIESADKNFIGLRETTRPAGELLRLVVRPQEVVQAIEALNVAYRAITRRRQRVQRRPVRGLPALGQPAQWVTSQAGLAPPPQPVTGRPRPLQRRPATTSIRAGQGPISRARYHWCVVSGASRADAPRMQAGPSLVITMNPIVFALRRPITVMMLVLALGLGGLYSIVRMQKDIFPSLNQPVLYVIHNYGGMDPKQIEGLITNVYELFFQYINGVEHVESQSIQSMVMLKLYFQPGTDMAEATAQTVAYCNRALSVMPVGSLPPYVVRLDAGSLPVGYLVFASPSALGRRAPGPGAVPGPADVLRPGGHLVAAPVRRQHPVDRRQRRSRPPSLLQPLAPGRRRRDRPRQLHQPLGQRDDQGPARRSCRRTRWSSTRRSCATSR